MCSIFVVWSLFFKKTTDEKEISNRFAFVRSSVSSPLFGLFFCQLSCGEGKRVLYSLGVTTYLFRRKTLCLRKEEERRKKKERTSFERERERSVVFSYVYLLL
jgi:hypothetical protein